MGRVSPALQAQFSSESHEWYTPARYVEAARVVLGGGIDLDPASCAKAQRVVKANRYFTKRKNGLSLCWSAESVFVNPPYGRQFGQRGPFNSLLWTSFLLRELGHGCIKNNNAILLVNASTSEKWFHPLWDYPICFTDHRIEFLTPSGESDGPTKGSAFVYFGYSTNLFYDMFSEFGVIVRRVM